MELTFQWFWLVKLTFLLVTLTVAYKAAWVHKMGSKFWNILLVVFLTFAWMMPIKMQPTTNQVNSISDKQIEQQHSILPPKVIDNSFNESVSSVKKISKEELK